MRRTLGAHTRGFPYKGSRGGRLARVEIFRTVRPVVAPLSKVSARAAITIECVLTNWLVGALGTALARCGSKVFAVAFTAKRVGAVFFASSIRVAVTKRREKFILARTAVGTSTNTCITRGFAHKLRVVTSVAVAAKFGIAALSVIFAGPLASPSSEASFSIAHKTVSAFGTGAAGILPLKRRV